MINVKNWIFALALAFVLSASSSFTYAQTSSAYQYAQQAVQVQTGRVLQVRDVQLDASTTAKTVGGVLGGALGAVLGNKVGQRSNNGFILTAALGTMGATGGAIAASSLAKDAAQEIVIQMDDNRVFAVAQATSDGVRFYAGQKVFVMNGRIAPLMN